MTSNVCTELMSRRKLIKRELKTLKLRLAKSPMNEQLCLECKVKDLLQWALKITTNSLYEALVFAEYNTYSPKCAESVTIIGRWALHIALAITQGLGGIGVYGDTDSVMFVIPDVNNPYRAYKSQDISW